MQSVTKAWYIDLQQIFGYDLPTSALENQISDIFAVFLFLIVLFAFFLKFVIDLERITSKYVLLLL